MRYKGLALAGFSLLASMTAAAQAQDNSCGSDRKYARAVEETDGQTIYHCFCIAGFARLVANGPCEPESAKPDLYVDQKAPLEKWSRPDTPEFRQCIAGLKPPTASYVRRNPDCGRLATTLYKNIKKKLREGLSRICNPDDPTDCVDETLRVYVWAQYRNWLKATSGIPNSPDWPDANGGAGQQCFVASFLRSNIENCNDHN